MGRSLNLLDDYDSECGLCVVVEHASVVQDVVNQSVRPASVRRRGCLPVQ